MIAQTCFIYAELAALFIGAGAVMFQLMGPACASLAPDEFCS